MLADQGQPKHLDCTVVFVTSWQRDFWHVSKTNFTAWQYFGDSPSIIGSCSHMVVLAQIPPWKWHFKLIQTTFMKCTSTERIIPPPHESTIAFCPQGNQHTGKKYKPTLQYITALYKVFLSNLQWNIEIDLYFENILKSTFNDMWQDAFH